jgi:hypothetical protein
VVTVTRVAASLTPAEHEQHGGDAIEENVTGAMSLCST